MAFLFQCFTKFIHNQYPNPQPLLFSLPFFLSCPQTGTEPFNRAMLFNVGFKEAMKDLDWNCLVFHDVDHLMENDRNYYGCNDMPRHFAVKLNKYSYMWVQRPRP